MKVGELIRIKIRRASTEGAKDMFAEGIVNGITSEYGKKTYIVSNAYVVGDIKTRNPIKIKK